MAWIMRPLSSTENRLMGGRIEGASTLTQQVAKTFLLSPSKP